MRLSKIFILLSFFAFSLFSDPAFLFSQSSLSRYQFCSPKPNSTGINPETAIAIRYGKAIDENTLKDDWLQVTGEISGNHPGKLTLTHDKLTLIFTPDNCFALSETISLHLGKGIKTLAGELLPAFTYGFSIRQKPYENFDHIFSEDFKIEQPARAITDDINDRKGSPISFADIPAPFIFYSKGATPGNIMTVLEKPPIDYLYLFNNNGTLLLARKTPHRVSNFKPHFSGVATYFDHVIKGHIKIDAFLNKTETLFMKNGYKPDAHDILLLQNGHIIMESYDPQLVDMSKVVEGGDPNATVIGLVIQELDENRNLVFEWRSWDHFRITDTYNELLASVVECVHCNSLDADTDSTLIFSSRNMNEITKINRLTGKIVWRLGGKNNEFVFRNDMRRFSAQHSVLKQKNGILTLFDNGNGLEPIYSRGIEYSIDELNKTVTLVNEYRHNPDVFAYVTGNLQKLDNGNIFIFWGTIVGQTGHIISEFDPLGNLAFEIRFDLSTYPTYASYRTKWDHKIFRLGKDTVNFAEVNKDDSAYVDLNVTNLSDDAIILTSAYGHNNVFKISNLPLSLGPLSTKTLKVEFHPESMGTFSDILTLCSETDSSIIARQLVVLGKSIAKTDIRNEILPDFDIYPNPVEKILEIKSFKMISSFSVFDLNGRIVKTISNPGNSFTIDMESADKGFYITVAIFSDKTKSIKRIIKQ
jgi:hypothetical protein